MTGRELLELLQDPEVRERVKSALGLPSEPVGQWLRELAAGQQELRAEMKELAQVLPLMFGFVVHPSAREIAAHLGVHVVASRPG